MTIYIVLMKHISVFKNKSLIINTTKNTPFRVGLKPTLTSLKATLNHFLGRFEKGPVVRSRIYIKVAFRQKGP
jgi:hypothetical protein